MAEPVMMPQVGQDIKTARIVDWLKKENDAVKKGEVIAVVESDKAAFDVEAYASGVLLKILYAEGDEVEVLTPIAYIGMPGERIEDGGPRTEDSRASVAVRQEKPCEDPRPLGERMAVSPSARRIVRERPVSLDGIAGSGPGGRIVKRDVLAVLDSGQDAHSQNEIVFSPMRMRIAERLTRSKQTIPHFYLARDVDMSEAMAWRRRFNEAAGEKVTVTDMIVKAVAMALAEYPKMNAHVEPGRMILQEAVNVGVAVSVEDGLIVPVVADADNKSVVEISRTVRENAEAARAGRLKPQAIGGFTVTNLGMYGVNTFVPVINPPEAAILAVGAVVRRPAVVSDQIVARDLMTMTLASDHRAVDGAYAARFLAGVKQYLEDPASFERSQIVNGKS
jgi:pyruvate dehydrogenase E2 component (dihydrolipoamide acetyltransferase)